MRTEDTVQEVSLVLCGEAGQGIQTVETLLVRLLKRCGYYFFSTKEYMSRVRGGSNSTSIRVSSSPVEAPVDGMDLFFPLSREALDHLRHRIGPKTVVIGECSLLAGPEHACEAVDVPFTALARELGGEIYANTIAVGVIAGLLGLDHDLASASLGEYFSRKSSEIIAANQAALARGFLLADDLVAAGKVSVSVAPSSAVADTIVMKGAEAVGLGALAGGCTFIASYPMSPGTGVLTFLAEASTRLPIVAEQAEDEIAAINMAIGASYAGARSMVTTSGGGFALMTEGVSLAGMLETPVVIHLAQRPGPATGLPTRTEQGDLDLALYAGHGEFPRAIFAPGNIVEAFTLSRHAFDLAERCQSPVFVLTDQYLMDTYYPTPPFDLPGPPPTRHTVTTTPDYHRYALTPSGLSPLGLPGEGDGLVVVDSDEHDEEGHITEDLNLRVAMQDKRMRKLDLLTAAALPPTLTGSVDADLVLVCWGSTGPIVREAASLMNRSGANVGVLHFSQVFPLHPDTALLLGRARRVAVVEGNATGQFARLVTRETGFVAASNIRKYNGLPFTVEELTKRITAVLEEEGR